MTLCACGCGQTAPIAHQTDSLRGYVKGEPRKYVLGHHTRGQKRALKTERVKSEDRGYKTPCLIWQLSITAKGYGQEWNPILRRMDFTHRVAWQERHGAIPKNVEIDHLCRVRSCRNVDHLELVTHLVNVSRSARRLPDSVRHRVRELANAGLSAPEISGALGISKTSVRRIVRE
jgi:hypothetical protein